MTTIDTTTVQVSTEVEAPITRAFHVFTAEIGTWWDQDKHILEAPLADMVFEPFVGGHIIDRGVDGSECRWARVLVYEPPHRVCFSWDIDTRWQIETDPERTSDIEISFIELTPESTRVVLTHRNLDRHGAGWERMRDAVGGGWNLDGLTDRIHRANIVVGRQLPVVSDAMMRTRIGAASTYTAVLLHTTDTFIRPKVDPIVWEHGRRNMALVGAGLLPIVLPVGDETGLVGIGIFAATAEDTRVIMDDDPAVRAGILTYQVHPARGFPGSTLP